MAIPETPLTRLEQYFNRIATGDGVIPNVPLTRIEQYLNRIATKDGAIPETPLTRTEQYLNKIATGEGAVPNVPLTRTEQYLAKIAGQESAVPEVPLSRMEQYLAEIAESGGGGGGGGGGILPSELQQVEWIGSPTNTANSGSAIITPCWLKKNTEVYCEFLYTGSGNGWDYTQTFGCLSPNLAFSNYNDSGATTYISFGNLTDLTITVPKESYFYGDDFHSIRMNAQETVIDSAYSKSYSATVTENQSRKIAVFARINGSNALKKFSTRRIRIFRLTEGDALALDLIPCYRKSDGEIGMYDTVSKTFLTNAGTGTFEKGADVT